ncbi:MAG: hypothetical protein ABJB86_13655 [Bacteroidota bacterium]
MNKYTLPAIVLLFISLTSFILKAGNNFPFQNEATFGYSDKGDSIEFVFGQQKKLR